MLQHYYKPLDIQVPVALEVLEVNREVLQEVHPWMEVRPMTQHIVLSNCLRPNLWPLWTVQ